MNCHGEDWNAPWNVEERYLARLRKEQAEAERSDEDQDERLEIKFNKENNGTE